MGLLAACAVVCLTSSALAQSAPDVEADPAAEEAAIEAELEALEAEAEALEEADATDAAAEPAEAVEAPDDEDLAELEAALAADAADLDATRAVEAEVSPVAGAVASMNPDISLILDFAAAWFSDEEPDLRGGHDPSDVGFNLQGLELAISADIDPYFRFDSAINFSPFGVEVEEAYATTLALPWLLQVRAGLFLTRFGRTNPTHLHAWHFVTQPLVVGKFFGGEALRGPGVEVSQLVPLPWYALWVVAVQSVYGEATGRSFAPSSQDIDSFGDLTVTPRIEQFFDLSPEWSLLWGVSYAVGRNGSGRGNVSEVWGTDLFAKWKATTSGGRSEAGWQTEVMLRRRQLPLAVLQDLGLSTFVFWQIDRAWEVAARYEWVTDAEAVVGEADVVDPLDPTWTEPRQRISANVSLAPSHFSRLRLEYELDLMPYRELEDLDEQVHQVFLQLELVAGAHGAHRY